MTDSTQDQRKEYLFQLSDMLLKIGEKGFRQLSDELGWDYESIQGNDVANKSTFWIDALEHSKSIPALVMKGQELFGSSFKNIPIQSPAPPRYYIASSLKEEAIIREFKIHDDRFTRTHNPQKGDYLIFDLDNPPENWITYLGTQEHVVGSKPYYGSTIFVQREPPEPGQEIGDIKLDGRSILCILNKLYRHRYRFNLAKTVDEMQHLLLTLEEDRATLPSLQIDRELNNQAMSYVR